MAYSETTRPSNEAALEGPQHVYTAICDDFMPHILEQNRPFIVGINGVDTAGKTEFAQGLSDELAERSVPVQIVHIDDFGNPRAVRNTTPHPVYNYYHHCFDLDRLVGEVLHPARNEGQLSTTINHIDLATDERILVRQYDAYPGTVLLLEGVFIFRPEIVPYLDYRIFLDISVDVMMERAVERDVPLFGVEVLDKYRDKYVPTQAHYIKEVNPASMADIVVDNSNWRRPITRTY